MPNVLVVFTKLPALLITSRCGDVNILRYTVGSFPLSLFVDWKVCGPFKSGWKETRRQERYKPRAESTAGCSRLLCRAEEGKNRCEMKRQKKKTSRCANTSRVVCRTRTQISLLYDRCLS